jgi:uncharacterized protein (TIGR03437 family)
LTYLRTTFTAAVLAIMPEAIWAAPPTIKAGGVVNAASYSAGITPGAWISIFGANLASSTATVGNADLVGGNLPTTYRGTSVTINGKPAFVQYVSPTQVNVQAPADTSTGPVQITVTTAEGSASTTSSASPLMPAVFTLAGNYVAAVRPSDSTVINGTGGAYPGYSTTGSARPGDVIELFANGLGATATIVNPGMVFTGSYPTVTTPTVTIGGKNADVSYSGLVGAGLYQLNVTVPAELTTGTYPVIVTQSSVSSPPIAYLNVAPVAAPSTGLTLVSSATTTTADAPVTLTATVSPAASTGTVTFYEGPVPIGTGSLSNGAATLSAAFSSGTHAITAVLGDPTAANATTSLATVVTVSPVAGTPNCAVMTGTAQVVCLTNAFFATLSSAQQTSVQYPLVLENVTKWSNLPVGAYARNGLRFGDLTSTQIAAVYALAQTALSLEGVERLQEIRGADEIIAPLNPQIRWGAANYYIALYGTPSTTSPWMLQISGHHFDLNKMYNSKYTSGTPYFIGSDPRSYTVHNVTYTPLQKQGAAMMALNRTLVDNAAAKLTGTFDDVVIGPDQPGGGRPGTGTGTATVNFPRAYPTGTSNRGVLASTLSTEQQQLIRTAIEAWVSDMEPATAAELLSMYESNDAIANTYVGYSGSGTLSSANDYIRIDGPRVWIEIILQTQSAVAGTIHYHSIWRDKIADYGGEYGGSQ